MTTTVTVKTYGHPVAVTVQSNSNYADTQRHSYGYSQTLEFVPAQSERDFTLSSGTTIAVAELEEGATGLPESSDVALGVAAPAAV